VCVCYFHHSFPFSLQLFQYFDSYWCPGFCQVYIRRCLICFPDYVQVINGVFIYGVITLLQQSHAPFDRIYLRFLTHTGLSVSIGQIRWYTSCFNRMFVRIGSWKPNYLKIWFTLGVCFGLVAMLLSVFLLSLLVLNTLGKKPVEQQVLTPVVSCMQESS